MLRSTTTSSYSDPSAQPFYGIVENTIHALRLVHAAQLGRIPRTVRRLTDAERRSMISSGSVFVFSVEESSIKRWTDSRLWSPSRIVGNFLVYRELNERSGARVEQRKGLNLGSFESQGPSPQIVWGQKPVEGGTVGISSRATSGALASQASLKVGGLMKKTITVNVEGYDLHVVSYYTEGDLQAQRLPKLSTRPDIVNLHLPTHIFRFSDFRSPPRIVTSSDGVKTIVCSTEEPETQTDEPFEDMSFLEDSLDVKQNAGSDWLSHEQSAMTSSQSFVRSMTPGSYSDQLPPIQWPPSFQATTRSLPVIQDSNFDPATRLADNDRRRTYPESTFSGNPGPSGLQSVMDLTDPSTRMDRELQRSSDPYGNRYSQLLDSSGSSSQVSTAAIDVERSSDVDVSLYGNIPKAPPARQFGYDPPSPRHPPILQIPPSNSNAYAAAEPSYAHNLFNYSPATASYPVQQNTWGTARDYSLSPTQTFQQGELQVLPTVPSQISESTSVDLDPISQNGIIQCQFAADSERANE